MKILASSNGNIPYQLVSMAAILRDYLKPGYKSDLHEKLTDIADSIYNVGKSIISDFKPEYKELYDKVGEDYFNKVIEDMHAIDSQLTSDAKVQELLADYEDRLGGVSACVKASGNPFYDKLSEKDKRVAKGAIKQMASEEEVTPENICELAMKLLPAEDIDHHATDLYIRKTPESEKLINKMKNKSLLSTFIDNIDHVVWYELPFCYTPEWEERLKGRY